MTLCGVTFPVHHLPGHSLDHIVIGTPDGVCFAGDALLTENVLRHVKLPYCDHVGLDLESKEAITKLPYQHWILSHKGPFDGNIRELADKNMDLVRLRLAELAKLLQRPMTRDEFYQESRRLIRNAYRYLRPAHPSGTPPAPISGTAGDRWDGTAGSKE